MSFTRILSTKIQKSFLNSHFKCLSTPRTVNSLTFLKGENSFPIMVTSENKITNECRKRVTFTGDISDDVWLSKAKRDEFMSYLPGIIDEIEAKVASYDHIDQGKHMRKLLEYVTSGSNRYTGLVAAETYKTLTPPSMHTSENLKLAYYLGWCCELFRDSVNTGDDIIDGGELRRNRPCWYRLEDVGLTAINDAFLLNAAKDHIVGKYFRHLDCYPDIVEIFNEVSLVSYIGQQMDLHCLKDIHKLTTKHYQEIALTDCTYAISYMPIALATTLADIDPQLLQKARPVLAELGNFYLIDHDYMDFFGDPSVNGKSGTDIVEGKCRWLAVVCMELANSGQKDIMKTHYGRNDPQSITAVKQLYLDLNLQQVYKDYTADLQERLMAYIERNLEGGIKEVCLKLIQSITYSRVRGKSAV